jgi:hypothetical protein
MREESHDAVCHLIDWAPSLGVGQRHGDTVGFYVGPYDNQDGAVSADQHALVAPRGILLWQRQHKRAVVTVVSLIWIAAGLARISHTMP